MSILTTRWNTDGDVSPSIGPRFGPTPENLAAFLAATRPRVTNPAHAIAAERVVPLSDSDPDRRHRVQHEAA